MTHPKNLSLTIIFMLGISISIHAEKLNIDSLKNELSAAREDSVKVNILMELGSGDNYSDRRESIKYYSQALKLNDDKALNAKIYNKIGYAYWQMGDYKPAIENYIEALNISKALNDSAYVGMLYNNIATSYWGLAENIEALKNYQLSLEIRRKVKDQQGVSNVLNNIGKLYQDLKLYDKALEMHKEALQIALEINNLTATAYSYSCIGECYQNTDDPKNALFYYQAAYQSQCENDANSRNISYYILRIGEMYLQTNQLDSALYYNRQALANAQRINNQQRIAFAQLALGEVFLKTNKIDSAQYYLIKSHEIALDKGYNTLLKDNLFALAELEEKKGDIKKAYRTFKSASELNDSIYSKEVVNKIADIQVKYVEAQQEQENAMLRKNNEIKEITIKQQRAGTIFLIILISLIIIVLIFIIRNHNSIKRLNKQLEESRRKLLQANKNKDRFFALISHDLKSPFSGMLGLAELLETKYNKLSEKELKEMLGLLRDAAENSHLLLEDLLQWSRLQFEDTKFDGTSFDIHATSQEVTSLLEQSAKNKEITIINEVKPQTMVFADEKSTSVVFRNLLTNALKFTYKGGTIKIQAEEKETEYNILVTDNGVGMTEEKISTLFSITDKTSEPGTNNETGTGLGLILCKEFIERNNGKIRVESQPGKGSTFIFSLKKGA